MQRLEIRPFEANDIPAAARLFAERHRTDRGRLPMFTQRLEAAEACEAVLRDLLANRYVRGAAALRGEALAGFVLGEEMLLAPEHLASQWVPPHSVGIPVQGHAVAAKEDATEVYRALYATLAGDWVARGYFDHRVNIVAGDAALQEAWLSLGFGRTLTAAVRDTGPVQIGEMPGLEVREASSEDIEVVQDLEHKLNLHHAGSPMFWPMLHTTDAAARQFNLAALKEAKIPFFVAYRDGKPIAMQTFLRPGFTPPLVEQSRDIYLFNGVVDPGERGGGIGTDLLEHTMRWAREKGYETCTLHFASMNPSGAPFWLRHGFVPVEHQMDRRIDERIAWANR